VAAGVLAEYRERLVHRQMQPRRDHSLGLFDDDPAGQRILQLAGEGFLLLVVALGENADGGDVRQRLADMEIGLSERATLPVAMERPLGWPCFSAGR
jgi:hypothetical protein